ncbi:hypothetical protein R1sor_026251 [Riccia sorocarpa]|uniref:Uncharacterized protein n=1 Tax=Riccia sorocarpa TaxID=122646 RepID=A0ABD3GAV9_9MARC
MRTFIINHSYGRDDGEPSMKVQQYQNARKSGATHIETFSLNPTMLSKLVKLEISAYVLTQQEQLFFREVAPPRPDQAGLTTLTAFS